MILPSQYSNLSTSEFGMASLGAVSAAASKTVCDKPNTVLSWGGYTFICRTCRTYVSQRICTDPEKPSTCNDVWVEVSSDTNCAANESWTMVR